MPGELKNLRRFEGQKMTSWKESREMPNEEVTPTLHQLEDVEMLTKAKSRMEKDIKKQEAVVVTKFSEERLLESQEGESLSSPPFLESSA